MGRGKRLLPKKLPGKLLHIRLSIGFSFEAMVKEIEKELAKKDIKDIKLFPGHISEFEKGVREPSLPILLAYSIISEFSLESLIDDQVDIP